MTYTAEQLRRDAVAIERMHGETLTVEWRDHQAGLLRAFADALEENARLRAELAKLRQHAEAMAESIDRTVFSTTAQQDALAAYRADFPGEK